MEKLLDLADISYGRIDYSLKAGDTQVWGINPNRMNAVQYDEPQREKVQRIFTPQLNDAFQQINPVSYKMWWRLPGRAEQCFG